MTIREAAQSWVKEFNAIPQEVIVKLMNAGDEIEEVTPMTEEQLEEVEGFLPMWGTMWSFSEPLDDWWLEEKNGLEAMARCGFRIYRQEDYGYIFGIDGAGYDFYEDHWIPLYKERGIQWHDTEE